MLSMLVWLVLLVIVAGVLKASLSGQEQKEDGFVDGFAWLKETTRSMGLLIFGDKGAGKSFAVARDLCWRTFMAGIAQFIIDPTGAICDNFLQKLSEKTENLPTEQQEAYKRRVWYVDMAVKDGYVVSWQFYTPLNDEPLYDTAQPLIELFLSLDPELKKAPVEGENALRTLGTYVGIILAALGFQISEAISLLDNPDKWNKDGWLDEAVRRNPQALDAVTWFKNKYIKWNADMKTRRSAAFRNKTSVFDLNPVQRALFGGNQGIDFDTLKQQGITLLIDVRHIKNEERLRFLLQFLFRWFLLQVRSRGLREKPIHLCVDELSRMVKPNGKDKVSPIEEDLQQLVNVEARNRGVFYTLMLQGLWQVDDYMKSTLLSAGNYMVGYQSDLTSAVMLAKKLFPYTGQPMVKRWEKVYSSTPNGPVLSNIRAVEYSIAEQELMSATAFTLMRGLHFLVRPALAEGTVTGPVLPMRVKEVGRWVERDKVEALRHELIQRCGLPLEEVLAEIDARMVRKPGKASATLSINEAPSDLPAESEGTDGQGVIWETTA